MSSDDVVRETDKYISAMDVTESNLAFWISELQAQHDRVSADMVHEDTYQMGYLHGMTYCIEYLKETLPTLEERRKWAKDARDGIIGKNDDN